MPQGDLAKLRSSENNYVAPLLASQWFPPLLRLKFDPVPSTTFVKQNNKIMPRVSHMIFLFVPLKNRYSAEYVVYRELMQNSGMSVVLRLKMAVKGLSSIIHAY